MAATRRNASFKMSFRKSGHVVLTRRGRKIFKCRDTEDAERFVHSFSEGYGERIGIIRDYTNFEAYLEARFPNVPTNFEAA